MNNSRISQITLRFSAVVYLTLVGRAAFAEDFIVVPVPEPGILALFTVGAAAAALVYRSRKK